MYGAVDPKAAQQIYDSHLLGGTPVPELIILTWRDGEPYAGRGVVVSQPAGAHCAAQLRRDRPGADRALHRARRLYQALQAVLKQADPAGVIEAMKASGLRGRGGAGFPTGLKWSFAAAQKAETKYVVCNADEGDPGAFMDRSVLEGDPHAVLEGMLVCGLRHRCAQGLHLLPRRVPAGAQAPADRHRSGAGARVPRREHPGQRLQL